MEIEKLFQTSSIAAVREVRALRCQRSPARTAPRCRRWLCHASTCPVFLLRAADAQVETKTRHEIEEKKKQLRSVVGDSYRCARCGSGRVGWLAPRLARTGLARASPARLPVQLHSCLPPRPRASPCCPARPRIPPHSLTSRRDLISSADTIIDISRSCQRLVDLTGGLQGGLGALAARSATAPGGGGAGAAAGEGGSAASSYDRLYALGSRIKYLVDTPETIYGASVRACMLS